MREGYRPDGEPGGSQPFGLKASGGRRGTPFTAVIADLGRIQAIQALRESACFMVYDKTGLGNAVSESIDHA